MLLTRLISFYNRVSSVVDRLEYPSSNISILDFDDIPTAFGLGTVPSVYHHLSFASYSILTPRDPALKGWISPNDINCAGSAPNALIGSRPGNASLPSTSSATHTPSGAYFFVNNATSMQDSGLQPYFTLHSFSIKPMDAPPPGTWIFVKGYSHARNGPYQWQVFFPAGYHLPFAVKMAEFSGETWSELYGVEILADFGVQALDWEFCMDDLEVMFIAKPLNDNVPLEQGLGQTPLKDQEAFDAEP